MGGHPDPKSGRIERLLGSRPDVFTVHVRTDRPKIDLEASVESGRDRRREKVLRFATPESGPNQLPQGVMVDGGLVTGRLDLSPDESSTPRLSVRTKIEILGSGLYREYQGSWYSRRVCFSKSTVCILPLKIKPAAAPPIVLPRNRS